MTSGQKTVRTAAILAAGLLFCTLTGCKSAPHEPGSAAAAAQLDAGGSFYFIGSTEPLQKYIISTLQNVEIPESSKFNRGFQDMQRQQKQRELIREYIYRLSGADQIKLIGASSMPLPEKSGASKFRNKIFLQIAPDARGVFNKLLPRQNQEILEQISSLPHTVSFAATASLQLNDAVKEIHSSGRSGTILTDSIPLDISTLTATVSGCWRIAAILPENLDDLDLNLIKVQIDIPDHDGKLFTVLANYARFILRFKVDRKEQRITSKPLGKFFIPTAILKNGRIWIYNSAESEKYFNDPAVPKLGSSKLFRELCSSDIPRQGAAAYFLRKSSIRNGDTLKTLPFKLGGIHFCNALGVVTRTDHGLLLVEHSDFDFATQLTGTIHLFISQFSSTRQRSRKKMGAINRVPSPMPMRTPVRPTVNSTQATVAKCRATLLGAGKDPAPGLCCPASAHRPYLRFTLDKLKTGKPLPLLMDMPNNHMEAFAVLYNNGEVRVHRLLQQKNCRRMISYLQTIHRWEEEVFAELIRQADIYDKNRTK